MYYVASGALLIEYFALRKYSRNYCGLVAIFFCDFFFQKIKYSRMDVYGSTFATHLL